MDRKNIKVDLTYFAKSRPSTSEIIEKLSKALADFSPEDVKVKEAFQSLTTLYANIDNSCIIENMSSYYNDGRSSIEQVR